jgi:hypothetical protein
MKPQKKLLRKSQAKNKKILQPRGAAAGRKIKKN